MAKRPNMSSVVALLLLELFSIAIITISFCNGSTYVGCIEIERKALLNIKQDLKDPSNRLASWNIGDRDCCKWAGVVCNNSTGHVTELRLGNPHLELKDFTSLLDKSPLSMLAEYEAYERSKLFGKINPSLLDIKHLSYLDLSGNDFEASQIPEFLGSMENLRYLNLHQAGFVGIIPYHLGNLSNLRYFDVGQNFLYELDTNFLWLSGLSLLEYLDFSGATRSNKAFDWLFPFPSLAVLKLSECQLHQFPPLPVSNFSSIVTIDLSSNDFQGQIPDQLGNLTSLEHLVLSANFFNSSIPEWLSKLSSLESLSLESNNLQGTISSTLGNLTSIKRLDLSLNRMKGTIPTSFRGLCNLRSIFMSDIELNQEIPEILNIFSGCVSNVLESLDLMNSQLSGHLTNDHLMQFKNLHTLRLSYNSIAGPIPSSLGGLSSLRFLDFSNNNLNGTFFHTHFASLTKLVFFSVSGNSLTLEVADDWAPPFQLEVLDLRSCHLGPQFPLWLYSQKNLAYLDLSNSRIADAIPSWFWGSISQIIYLNFSHNQIHGQIPDLTEATQLESLDLSFNDLSGQLPLISLNVLALDVSNNSLLGSMSPFLCYGNELRRTQILKLTGNVLSGELPDCWMNWSNLLLLDLTNNKFTSNLPTSMGALIALRSLHLGKNSFSGAIPVSLKNCLNLVTLDMSENEFTGDVPTWIGERFSKMVILNIRSNKFYGILPVEICSLSSLHILDLAHNNLFGSIPRCVNNFSAMTTTRYSTDNNIEYLISLNNTSNLIVSPATFLENQLLVMKGQKNEYNTILNLVRSIDLSSNNFSGEIPTELTNLGALQSLNLSHNSLSGRIPTIFDAMRSLECIDFSVNKLSGEIPPSLSSLSFLNHLNLSHNNLSGKIPFSTQLQSFDASCFAGNDLCGSPLPKNCTDDYNGEVKVGGDKHDEVNWPFFVSMILGFVVSFWIVVGPLFVDRKWRFRFYHFLDLAGDKFVCVVKKCF